MLRTFDYSLNAVLVAFLYPLEVFATLQQQGLLSFWPILPSLKAFLPFTARRTRLKVPTYVSALWCATHATKNVITILYPYVWYGFLKLNRPRETLPTIAHSVQELLFVLTRSSWHDNLKQLVSSAAAGSSRPSPHLTEDEVSNAESPDRNSNAGEASPEKALTIQSVGKWATLIFMETTRLLFLPLDTLFKRSVALSFLGSPAKALSSSSASMLHEVYPKGSWFGLGSRGGQVLDYSTKLMVCVGLQSIFKCLVWHLNHSYLAYDGLL